MYQRIVVPIDGSDPSRESLSEAIRIAQRLKSTLSLLHVVDELTFDYADSPALFTDKMIEGLLERGRALLAEAQGRADAAGVAATATLDESRGSGAAARILAHAKEWRADLIVIGTHGRRGLIRLAIGSDAEQVVRGSPLPVLLIHGLKPPPAERAAEVRRP